MRAFDVFRKEPNEDNSSIGTVKPLCLDEELAYSILNLPVNQPLMVAFDQRILDLFHSSSFLYESRNPMDIMQL